MLFRERANSTIEKLASPPETVPLSDIFNPKFYGFFMSYRYIHIGASYTLRKNLISFPQHKVIDNIYDNIKRHHHLLKQEALGGGSRFGKKL